ncbi:hypothetical protein BCR36DRAFT_412539 [Piromyces finnis]|uniref:SS18 N-terminal domain-containing protein n=1 Tax=Piromyces finnis TaxID=1754191 RepID=A0A1Y1V8Y7_9FUNG|nr:hypothetical protein BCR36DRAFT_412539 [Piromyces finnis]|eukprot:ORX50047.1 hypothetical protein BCR36DRAFT_412539 [Piromyces finnis]
MVNNNLNNSQNIEIIKKNPIIINNTSSSTSSSSTISLQNNPNNNKNKLTSKGEDSGSVLQPVLVPQLGYSTIQNILEINKKLIKVLIEYQNYGWIEDPDFIIYQRRLQTNLSYLATVADNYLNFDKISLLDLSPVTFPKKLKRKLEEGESTQQQKLKDTKIKSSTILPSSPIKGIKNEQNVSSKISTVINGNTINTTTTIPLQDFPKKIKKEEKDSEEEVKMEKRKDEKINKKSMEKGYDENETTLDEKDSIPSSFEDILPTLPPPYFISDPNIYDQTELDNVSPIDPGSYVPIQPFVIPEQIQRPPAVDKSKDVGYLTPGVTRAIFKGRWEGITLGGNNNNNTTNNN